MIERVIASWHKTPTLFWRAGVPPILNMDIQTIKDFCKSKGFTQINKMIAENSNGYPFITFINGANKAENIYFSKSMSANVAEGQLITPSLLADLQVATVKNANGEERIKLCGKGESNRLSLDDLL